MRLLVHWMRRAASRAAWTAGKSNAISTAMMAMTTRSSIRVNAFLLIMSLSSSTQERQHAVELRRQSDGREPAWRAPTAPDPPRRSSGTTGDKGLGEGDRRRTQSTDEHASNERSLVPARSAGSEAGPGFRRAACTRDRIPVRSSPQAHRTMRSPRGSVAYPEARSDRGRAATAAASPGFVQRNRATASWWKRRGTNCEHPSSGLLDPQILTRNQSASPSIQATISRHGQAINEIDYRVS